MQEIPSNEGAAAMQMLKGIAALPSVLELLREHSRHLEALRFEIARKQAHRPEADGWLDAKAAAKYLNMSDSTFDKYRYQTTPRIKGYKLDGKTLYKKADLDAFVMLYEVNSRGLP
jgi:hypothetical protein